MWNYSKISKIFSKFLWRFLQYFPNSSKNCQQFFLVIPASFIMLLTLRISKSFLFLPIFFQSFPIFFLSLHVMESIDTYHYVSITVPEVSILIDTSLYRYFPSLGGTSCGYRNFKKKNWKKCKKLERNFLPFLKKEDRQRKDSRKFLR